MSGPSARFALSREDRPSDLQPPDLLASPQPGGAAERTLDPGIGLALEAGGIAAAIGACEAAMAEIATARAAIDEALAARDWQKLAAAADRLHGLTGHFVKALAARARRAVRA